LFRNIHIQKLTTFVENTWNKSISNYSFTNYRFMYYAKQTTTGTKYQSLCLYMYKNS
jgi:hypothetical protein